MASNSANGSRLDRIEALMLELATASLRHDNEFSRINSTLASITVKQEQNQEAIAKLAVGQEQNQIAITNLTAKQDLNQEAIANLTAKQDLNQEAIANLTASIQDLRNLVADYIQGRS